MFVLPRGHLVFASASAKKQKEGYGTALLKKVRRQAGEPQHSARDLQQVVYIARQFW
jgi:hypothetical protein